MLESLFQDDAKEYALWRIGKILKGGEEKTFTVLIGNGNNGKTKVFVELIKHAFGDFFNSPNSSLITTGKYDENSERPQPEKLELQESMINVVNELKEGAEICTQKLKE